MNDPRHPNNDAPAANTVVVSLASTVANGVFLPVIRMIVTGHIFTSVLSYR